MRASAPGESALLLLDVVDVLDDLSISYAVVGAMAASVHGVVRASIDADALLLVPASKSLKNLESRLAALGLRVRYNRGGADDPIAGVLSSTDRHKNRVDLLIGLRHFPKEASERRTTVPFMGSQLQVVGLEDFIAMKLYAGGPKDLDDVRNALLTQKSRIRLPLLRKLAKGYGTEPLARLDQILAARQ